MEDQIQQMIAEKRKSRRRSSIAAGEALKLMNLDGSSNSLSDLGILEKVANIQLDWIQTQLKEIKSESNYANKIATKSSAALKSAALESTKIEIDSIAKSASSYSNPINALLNYTDEQYQRDYETINEKQREFLAKHTISEDYVIEVLKKRRLELMKKECEVIYTNNVERLTDFNYLKSKSQRSSISNRRSFDLNAATDPTVKIKDPMEVLNEFFESQLSEY